MKMVKFTRQMDESLIELIKTYKNLYDPSDEHFKNLSLKCKCWEHISEVLRVPVSEIKKRWRSLRDQYNKKRKGSELIERTNSHWEYMSQMTFLSDCLGSFYSHSDPRPAKVTGSVDEQSNAQEGQGSEDQGQQRIEDEASRDDFLNTEDSNMSQNRNRIKKKSSLNRISRIIERNDAKRSALYEKLLNKQTENKSAIQKFFDSMADTVNKLPPHLQAEIRLKVCQIVTETEVKYLTAESSLDTDIIKLDPIGFD